MLAKSRIFVTVDGFTPFPNKHCINKETKHPFQGTVLRILPKDSDQLFGSTRVGAIRLFLGSLASSFSLSLASRLLPATVALALRGVSGGVVNGTPVTLPEFVAAMPGTLPEIRVGLVTTPAAGTVLACVVIVATDDVEFDLAGDDGR
jgi:hypothetical protein